MKKMVFIFLIPMLLQAQWSDGMYKKSIQPRIMLGGQASLFRISVHNFEDIYTSRWGDSFGACAGVRAFGAHYITVKYGSFQKEGKSGVHESGLSLDDAHWQENWYKIGLRIHPPVEKKWSSYYGFGLGFYNVQENEPLSIFQKIGQASQSADSGGTGFYFELGIDYFVVEKLAAFFEIEIASGGSRGRSSFEAMSVGGWLFSVGVTFWPF